MAAARQQRRSVFVARTNIDDLLMEIIDLEEIYDLQRRLGNGRFGAVHYAVHRATGANLALKIFPKATVKQADFLREYNYSLFLAPHQQIVDTYEKTYATAVSFFFAQEFAPYGNLKESVEATTNGLPEESVKLVLEQLIGALSFMHNEGLVHRDIQAKNLLVFDPMFTRVKLCDFANTRKQDTMVKHSVSITPYQSPELCSCLEKEPVSVDTSTDVWAVGILAYYALKGRFPWERASIMCKPYWEWEEWMKGKSSKMPAKLLRFSDKLVKLMKNSLNPRPKDRSSIKELRKYLKGKWIKEAKVNLHAG